MDNGLTDEKRRETPDQETSAHSGDVPQVKKETEGRRETPDQEAAVHAESALRTPEYVMKGHHCHSCYELFYCEAGECRFLVQDQIYDMNAGDFILIPPWALHYTRYLKGPCRRTVILFENRHIHPELTELMPHGKDFFSAVRIFQVPEGNRDTISILINQMLREERIHDLRSALMAETLLNALLIQCSRFCDFRYEPPEAIHTTDREILSAARFIAEQYMNSITSEEIANAAGLSLNYLTRKFRRLAGIGLHEYLVFIRLQHAARELVSTDDSITDIALRCGFSDSNYFKDAFKKKYGMTPRIYRGIK